MTDIPIEHGYINPNTKVYTKFLSPWLCNTHSPNAEKTIEGLFISLEPIIKQSMAKVEAPIFEQDKIGVHIELFGANTGLYTAQQFHDGTTALQ